MDGKKGRKHHSGGMDKSTAAQAHRPVHSHSRTAPHTKDTTKGRDGMDTCGDRHPKDTTRDRHAKDTTTDRHAKDTTTDRHTKDTTTDRHAMDGTKGRHAMDSARGTKLECGDTVKSPAQAQRTAYCKQHGYTSITKKDHRKK